MARMADTGVVFPLDGDRRSTTHLGREVVADALSEVDPVGASSARRETNWRREYLPHFKRLVEAGLSSPEAARTIARDGLASIHRQMRWAVADQPDQELDAAFATSGEPLGSATVTGETDPIRQLSVPYRGNRLSGSALTDQLATWVTEGVIEPSAAEAVSAVVTHPEWLDLSDQKIVVLGAASEMGPLRSLLRWGADVHAVDLPRPDLWKKLFADTTKLAGSLTVPVSSDSDDVAAVAGGDLITDLGRVTEWIERINGPLTLGNYVYADGATNVRVSTAVDAMSRRLMDLRGVDQVGLAFLATPTDVFAVPREAVEMATANYEITRVRRTFRAPVRALSGGRLLTRNYRPDENPGLSDSVVLQQGPNYLLAKRLQRWRATDHRAAGGLVSFTVAPPTRTRSVVKNRVLAAAYAGAHRFGIEVFEPGTANTLMAAKLVHDLRTGGGPAHEHPWQDEAYAAAHGGLWRAGYDPRSALGIAAVLGMAARP